MEMTEQKTEGLTKINGQTIYQAFISGANEVIKEKIELNRINVFPISDCGW